MLQNYDISALKRYKDYVRRVQEEKLDQFSPSNHSFMEKKLARLRDIIRGFPVAGTSNEEEGDQHPSPTRYQFENCMAM